jgi:hypothetical protein
MTGGKMDVPTCPNDPGELATHHVRKYIEKDLKSVMELYEHVMNDYVHFSLNEDFLKYYMQFPGVTDNGVLVVEERGKIVGFEIISIVHQMDIKIGSVIIFLAADPLIGRLLLESSEDYCIDQNVDLIMAVPPPRLSKIFDKYWSRFQPGVLIAKDIKLVPLLDAVLCGKQDLKKLLGNKTINLSVENEFIQICIKKDILRAEKLEQTVKNNSMIVIDKRVLLNIVFGQVNPIVEYVRGNFSITCRKDLFMILRFLKKIGLKDSIFTSLADRI